MKKQRKKVATKFRKSGTAPTVDTPGRRKNQWALPITSGTAEKPLPRSSPPWTEEGQGNLEQHVEQLRAYKAVQHLRDKAIKKNFTNRRLIPSHFSLALSFFQVEKWRGDCGKEEGEKELMRE